MNNFLQSNKKIPSCKSYYTSTNGDTYYYHSASELAVMMLLDETGKKWEKNTKLRIPCVLNGVQRSYIPDFIIHDKPVIIMEIKGHKCDDLDIKMEALKKYCDDNKYIYTLIDYVSIRALVNWEHVKAKHKECLAKNSKI